MEEKTTIKELLEYCGDKKYKTIYADPPWQFVNRSGKIAPENKKLTRYETMTLDEIKALPVNDKVREARKRLYIETVNEVCRYESGCLSAEQKFV